MKKYILSALILLTVHSIYAQGISLNPKVAYAQGANADTIDLKEARSIITNNLTDPTDNRFSWTIINFSKPIGWQIDLCDPFNCYTNINPSTTQTFTLNIGDSNVIKTDFYSKDISGSGSYGMVIKSVKNPSIADTLTLNGTAWLTGVNEVSKTKTMSFYPNPVKDQLTLKFPVKDGITVEIYNVLGTRVKSFMHNSATTSVNLSDLQNGVYFIRFTDNGKLYTKQFTKAE